MKKILMLSMIILAVLVISGCCCTVPDLGTLAGGLGATATPTVKPTTGTSKIPTPAAGAQGKTFAGTWDTTYGKMTLTVNGNVVTGTYESEGGMLSGAISGNTLTGVWTELPTRFPPDDAGDLVFTLSSDGDSFTGKWRYGSSGDEWDLWDGTRIDVR